MPHVTMMATRLNSQGANGFADAAGVIENAASCQQLAGDLGLTANLNADEVAAFFAALPASVDATILAAVKSSASRGVPFNLHWVPAAYYRASVHEAVDEGSGIIGVTLESPWVRDIRPGQG